MSFFQLIVLLHAVRSAITATAELLVIFWQLRGSTSEVTLLWLKTGRLHTCR